MHTSIHFGDNPLSCNNNFSIHLSINKGSLGLVQDLVVSNYIKGKQDKDPCMSIFIIAIEWEWREKELKEEKEEKYMKGD